VPPRPAASAPAAGELPPWAAAKLAAARADPKVHERAYRQGAKLADFCANCHGPSGQSARPDVPNLAGQNTVYVLRQLANFQDGHRKGSFFMPGLVKAMSNDERFAVALYFTSQQARALAPASPALAAQGKAVYAKACGKCHGADGAGGEDDPRIAGQQPEYLEKSIRGDHASRVGMDQAMSGTMKGLADADIKALVAYIGAMR